MHDPATRDATLLKKALSEKKLNLRVATEIICSRTPSQIQLLRPLYYNMFRVYLEHDIENQAHGDHKKVSTLSLTSKINVSIFVYIEPKEKFLDPPLNLGRFKVLQKLD